MKHRKKMNLFSREYVEIVASLIVLLSFFVVVSYVIRQNMDIARRIIPQSLAIGIPVYIFLAAFDAVALPIIIPFIPLASNLYGFWVSSICILVGWTIGILVSFYIMRKYGRRYISQYIPLKKVDGVVKKIPEKQIFLFILLLRIIMPLNVVSYSAGIFKKVSTRTYFIASFIGIIPPAFLFSYAGGVNMGFEIIGLLIAVLSILIVGRIYAGRRRRFFRRIY